MKILQRTNQHAMALIWTAEPASTTLNLTVEALKTGQLYTETTSMPLGIGPWKCACDSCYLVARSINTVRTVSW